MSLIEVTSEDIQEHLSFLNHPERVIEKPHKILEVETVIFELRPVVRRRFEIPISATFWDLYIAIQNVYGWRFIAPIVVSAHDPYNFNRPFLLSGPLIWNTQLHKYMLKAYHACTILANHCRIRATIKRRDDPVPGRTYPYFLSGENPAPPERILPFLLEHIFDDEFRMHEDLSGNGSFDPREVSFDNPEEVWIEHFCEERVTAKAVEKVVLEHPEHEPLYVFPLVFPRWFRDLLIRDELAPPHVLSKARDDPEHPGFTVLPMSRLEIANLIDTIHMKQFQSQDLHLNRRLERLMCDIRCAHWVIDDRSEA